jgi:hypothetical protein
MKAFRLVNCDHDPITVGAYLERASTHSKQKLCDGMYFSTSREDALEFAKKNHGHKYTHLLTCELRDMHESDFVDRPQSCEAVQKSGSGKSRIADAVVTGHLDLEFQGLTGMRRNTKARQGRELLKFPDCSRDLRAKRRKFRAKSRTDWHRRSSAFAVREGK